MKSKPYLSVIITCRNDDYQGDVIGRLQMTINSLIWQANQYNLRAELIIVDWNPPSERPLLKEVISLPDDLGSFVVRFIVVPPSVHKTYKCSEKKNIACEAALNVGIRRAQGGFILPICSDILFSNELTHFLSLENLKKDRFYRTLRYDVHRDVLKYTSLKEVSDFSKKNIVEAYPRITFSPHGLAEHPSLQIPGVDFILFSKEYWHLIHGWPEVDLVPSDWLLCYVAYLAGLKEEMLDDSMRVYHIDHSKHKKRRQVSSKNTVKNRVYCFLRNRVYHRLGQDSKLRRLTKRINILKWRYQNFEFYKVLVEMLKGKRSYIYNDDRWGWPQKDFKEFLISSEKKQ